MVSVCLIFFACLVATGREGALTDVNFRWCVSVVSRSLSSHSAEGSVLSRENHSALLLSLLELYNNTLRLKVQGKSVLYRTGSETPPTGDDPDWCTGRLCYPTLLKISIQKFVTYDTKFFPESTLQISVSVLIQKSVTLILKINCNT